MFTPIEEEPATPTVNQELALVPEQAQLQVVKPSAETKDDRTHTEMLAIEDGSRVIQPLNLNRMSEEVKLLVSIFCVTKTQLTIASIILTWIN